MASEVPFLRPIELRPIAAPAARDGVRPVRLVAVALGLAGVFILSLALA